MECVTSVIYDIISVFVQFLEKFHKIYFGSKFIHNVSANSDI